MGKVDLYIGIALRENVKPSDLKLLVTPSEDDGVDIVRDSDDNMENFLIDSESTVILGRELEELKMDNYDPVVELELQLHKDVEAKDVGFFVYDHYVNDGFTVAVHQSKVDKEKLDSDIVIPESSFIIRRIKG